MIFDMMQLFISRIPRLSTSERLLLSELFSTIGDLMNLHIKDLEQIIRRRLTGMIYNPLQYRAEVEAVLNDIDHSDTEIIYYWDSSYPPLLREIYDPPFLLYKKGGVLNNDIPAIAVVGTRLASSAAFTAAYNLGLEMAALNICLVSGLAAGIDKAAHEGVVKGKGQTVAVLGNGIDYIYPKENAALGREIIELGGVVLSEYSPGTAPLRYNFPARNRIISGLSRSIVVVEAPGKSGALITADFALEQGRDVFVHSCSLKSKKGLGCRKLVASGAGIINSAEEIISLREAV